MSAARWGMLLALAWLACAPGPSNAKPPPFPGATESYRAWVAAHLPGNPEGLALDRDGTLYAGLWQSGQIVALSGDGGYRPVAFVPSRALGAQGITVGMEFGADGQLYVAYMWHYSPEEEVDPRHPACRNAQDVYTGIYRVDVRSGAVAPLLTKRDGWPVCFPDDIAVDHAGNLYVTDLTLSGIWKVTSHGKYVLWSADPLLQWAPAPFNGFPEGANDLVLARDGQSLYVVTDGNPALIRIPIRADGTAGAARIVSRDLTMLDGIERDDQDNLYVAEPYRNELSVFSPDGTQRIVIATAETAPLNGPTSLVYRDGVLCTANSGMGPTAVTEARTVACISGFRRPVVAPKKP